MTDPTAPGSLTVLPTPSIGCEDVVVALDGPDEGCIFTGTEDGSILRLSADGDRIDRVARTGGRPLGIEIDPDGRLLVADAERGLLRIDVRRGERGEAQVELLADRVDGTRMKLVDNGAIGPDGDVWFSDSSTRFGLDQWRADLVQDTRTGRLLRRDPDGSITVEIDGLAFANGVAVSRGGDFVCVAETGARGVRRRWLTGDRAGQVEVFVADLPGYPDNLSLGSDGLIWVALASPRVPTLERLQRGPERLRRAATRLPPRLQPAPTPSVHVQAYDDAGRLVHDLALTPRADPHREFHMVTGVREHDGRVWLGSLAVGAVAVTGVPSGPSGSSGSSGAATR